MEKGRQPYRTKSETKTKTKTKTKRAKRYIDESIFFNLFSDEVQFSMLAPFLKLSDASKIRTLCKLGRSIVSKTPFDDFSKTAYDAVKFKACFPCATAMSLESTSGKLRDFPLESILFLRIKVFDKTPLRLFDRCPKLESVEIHESTNNAHFDEMMKRLPASLWVFSGQIFQRSMKYLSKVEGMVSLMSSPITSLEGLSPNLYGLNLCGCYNLRPDALATMPCLNLNCINLSYTHLSNAAVRQMRCAATLLTIAFGFNCSIDDEVFQYLPNIRCLFVHAASNPFSEMKLRELKAKGVLIDIF